MKEGRRIEAIALLSGGLDSCVASAWARRRYGLWLLHANSCDVMGLPSSTASTNFEKTYDASCGPGLASG